MGDDTRVGRPVEPCAVALAQAGSARDAAEVVVRFLADRGIPLPSVYLLRGGRLRCQAQYGYGQVLDGIPAGAGVIGRAVGSGRTIVVGDATVEDDFLAAAPDLRAEICAPIRCDGDVVGAVNVESREPFGPDVLATVEACAEAYGRRLHALGGPPAETPAQRVARLAGTLAGLDDEARVLHAAVDAAIQVSGLPTAAIVTRRGAERVGLEVAEGPLAGALRRVEPSALAALADWVAAGTSMFTAGATIGALPVHGGLEEVGVATVAVVPLDARGRQLGILLVASAQPETIAPDMIASMEVLGSQTATNLLVARTVAQLQDRARRDPLTGLGHGATFREELQAALATGRALGVMLIDVDDFKSVNDRLGHLEGDRLLERLSATLSGALRADDRLYRIGGDEFAVLLRVSVPEEAEEVAGRVIEAVRDREPSTISVGIAMARRDEDPDDVIARADEAMYAAKAGGRDRAELVPSPH